MPRIYYPTEELLGKPFKSPVINTDSFDDIVQTSSVKRMEIPKAYIRKFFFFKKEIPSYKWVWINDDGIEYNSSDAGLVFLPKSIVFTDDEKPAFPHQYFYIAKVKDDLELGAIKGGEGVKWFDTIGKGKSVTDKNILLKIENTFLLAKKLVEIKYNKQELLEAEKRKEEERRKIEENRPLVSDEQKDAYKKLTALCLPQAQALNGFFDKLKDYEGHPEYMTTLNYVMDQLDENDIYCFLRLDWKAGVEDLNHLLKLALKKNFRLSLKLPEQKEYDEDITISELGVFGDFDKVLKKKDLQMGFVKTDGDEYVVLVHKMKDWKTLKDLVKRIGYDFCNSSELIN